MRSRSDPQVEEEFESDRGAELIYDHLGEWEKITVPLKCLSSPAEELAQL